jgi:hypothetical protein
MDILQYIKNGLPHITFGEFIVFFTAISVILKLGEDLAGKKYFGNFLYQEFKKVITTPGKILRKLDEIQSEVTYNGGKYKLKDAVFDLTQKVNAAQTQAIYNGNKLNEIEANFRLSDDIDDAMKFKLDETGACYYANRSLYSHFGFVENSIAGFNWENYIVVEDMERVHFKYERSIKTRSEFIDTHGIKHFDGVIKRYDVRTIPIIIGDVLKGFYGTIKEAK